MNKKQNKKSKFGRFIFSILCLAIITVLGTGAVVEIKKSFQLKDELQTAKSELDELNTKKETLNLEKEKLSDPAYVENYARGTHLLSKDDEQVFVLPKGE